jgi:streptomycin 3"-adenylyltransferase
MTYKTEEFMDCNLILQRIKDSYSAILQGNLIGIYVHGSVAFGCFDRCRSDIDYIAVVNEPLTLDVKNRLFHETLQISKTAPPKGLEMSVVLKTNCINFRYPTPYEMHFSSSHHELTSGTDTDLAAHFTVIKHTGIVLCGEPVDKVFGDVSRADFFSSIKSDIENARAEAYYILNLCRTLAFKNSGLILSKKAGGEWGLANIDSRYGEVIKAALKNAEPDVKSAEKFCKYMLNEIM